MTDQGKVQGQRVTSSNYIPKVSILVPVYNVSHFLSQCLDSLINQTLRDIQIICINDGSTDNSLAILHDYAKKDERIIIIDKPNTGYGSSMNHGLDIARGEYIGITESDDFAGRKMFTKLYETAKQFDADLVKSNYYEYSRGRTSKIKLFSDYPYKKVLNPSDIPAIITSTPAIWSGLYRREMLLHEKIRFNETPGASFQDTSFVQRVWFSAQRVVLLRDAFLHYRVDNIGSSVKSDAKVYEVCGEFATSEAFLRKNSQRLAIFMPMLNRQKFDVYRWNYNRIDEKYREEFIARWAKEYKEARVEGVLRQELFNDSDWRTVQELLKNPEAFFTKHRESL